MQKKNSGQALISTMVALAISGIVILVVLSITDQQNKSLRFFELKSELIEQKNFIQNIFAQTQVCDWQFSSLTQTLNVTAGNTNADGIINSTLNLTKIHSGVDASSPILAQVNQDLGLSKLKVDSITYKNIRAAGVPDYFIGDLEIAFQQNPGQMQMKPISISKTVVVNSGDPDTAKKVRGCEGGVNATIPYPTQCSLKFGHQDNGGAIHQIIYPMNKPGYMGLTLSGDVNGDDKFYIGGGCTSAPAGSMAEYIRTCSVDIGMRDSTDNSNYTQSGVPTSSTSHSMSNLGSMNSISMTGNVNSDDSFYFRFKCPAPGNDNASYFFNNCYICFGQSDDYRPHIERKVCAPMALSTSTKWSRFRFGGDVNGDDIIFMGFYCQNSAGDVVHGLFN